MEPLYGDRSTGRVKSISSTGEPFVSGIERHEGSVSPHSHPAPEAASLPHTQNARARTYKGSPVTHTHMYTHKHTHKLNTLSRSRTVKKARVTSHVCHQLIPVAISLVTWAVISKNGTLREIQGEFSFLQYTHTHTHTARTAPSVCVCVCVCQ